MKIIKLIPLVFLFIFFVQGAHSKEISKGTFEVSGDSSFSFGSSETKQDGFPGSEDTDSLSLSVTGAYYVAPNLGVGLLWTREDQDSNDGVNNFSFNLNILGPLVEYNLSIAPASSLVFLAGIVLIGDYESESNGFTTSKGDISGHILGVSFKQFIVDSVSIDFGIGLTSLTLEEDGGGDVDTDSTDFSIGLSVYFL